MGAMREVLSGERAGRDAAAKRPAAAQADAPRPLPAIVRDTNFQWYLSRARNTVYFAAFTPVRMTAATFRAMVADVVGLAPQLNLRHDDQLQAHVDARPFDLAEIASFAEVPSFAGFPDKVLGPNEDLFKDPRLPCFRASCFRLAEGAEGRNRSFVLFRASHALMEGVDTSQVLRGRPSDHGSTPRDPNPRLAARLSTGLVAILAIPINFAIAALHWRKTEACGLRTLVFDRGALKRAAVALGVQQRSLLFGLIMYGLHHQGEVRRQRRRPRMVGYSNITPRRVAGDDEFVRLRMQLATLRYRPAFADYVRHVDQKLGKAGKQSFGLQMHYNAIFGLHRRIARRLPFLYGRRFFSFVPYDFVLSLVPPHVTGGVFADLQLNDVYCGSHTPGVNCCVIVPQGDRVSLNIYGPDVILDRTGGITALLAELGIQPLVPSAPPMRALSSGVA